ncbi:thioredoxin [candidate division TM6 bacterium RIFCSPHIGHO2_12_FULL_36_22]|nr:MAG: thioredoxin [candidate division TM6 bacterium RIFCSPHIGHO2_12_FULL_36_22]
MAIELGEANFTATIKESDKPVVIKAFASWCGPCQQMEPIFEEVEKEFANKAIFATLDVDNARELAIQLGITSIPTTILFKNGEIRSKEVGFMSKDDLVSKLEAFLK